MKKNKVILLCLFSTAALISAQTNAPVAPAPTATASNATASAAAPEAVPSVSCPTCTGAGMVPCKTEGCNQGHKRCPKPCLKLDEGQWIHMDVAGHSKEELWRKFEYKGPNGELLYQAWSQGHVGEIVEYRDRKPVNVGKCPSCKGVTRVPCSMCNGKGNYPCWACGGTRLLLMTGEVKSFLDAQNHPDPAMTLSVVQVAPKNFPFFFGGVSESGNTVKYLIQRRDGKGMYPVKDGESIPDEKYPGFKIVKFTPKFNEIPDPTIMGSDGKPRVKKIDVSEITLQKGDEKPVDLVKGSKAEIKTTDWTVSLFIGAQKQTIAVDTGDKFSILGNPYVLQAVEVKAEGGVTLKVQQVKSGQTFSVVKQQK